MLGGPLALVFGPIFYIFLSALSLSQFKIVYNVVSRAIYQKSGNPLWRAVQPALKQQLTFFESIFGSPATFIPSTTHVLLVALMLVLIVQLDGVRRALAARR